MVAERMNALPKVVFSRKLRSPGWKNARGARDPVAESRRLKAERGDGLALMGSGTIVSLLAPTSLVDEYQLVLIPVVLGAGRTIFEGVEERLRMTLVRSRTFRIGKVFLSYAPADAVGINPSTRRAAPRRTRRLPRRPRPSPSS